MTYHDFTLSITPETATNTLSITLSYRNQTTTIRNISRSSELDNQITSFTHDYQQYCQTNYNDGRAVRICICEPSEPEPVDPETLKATAIEVKNAANNWLQYHVLGNLITEVVINDIKIISQRNEKIRLLLKIQDNLLKAIPWDEIPILNDNFSTPEFALTGGSSIDKSLKVNQPLKVLIILGDGTNLNLKRDRTIIKRYLSRFRATITELNNYTERGLIENLNKNTYDIIFFCGHSLTTPSGGNIGIAGSSVDLNSLKETLKKAALKGTKLMVFNSCDGLGLGATTVDCGIPYVVVMRFPIFDEVAHSFLRSFLQHLSRELPLEEAIRNTSEDLRSLESNQGQVMAHWLPVIFQRPSAPPLIFKIPLITKILSTIKKFQRSAIALVLLAVIAASLAVMAARKPEVVEGPPPTPNYPLFQVCREQRSLSCTNNLIFNFPKDEDLLAEEQEGTEKFLTGDYQKAIELFTKAWEAEKDPSTLISLNNARVLGQVKSRDLKPEQVFTLATPIPIESTTPEFIAKEVLAGVAQQQEDANQKHQDFKILVVMANDRNDPEYGFEIAKKIIAQKPVVGVVGHFASRVTSSAIIPYTDTDKKIPLISATSAASKLCEDLKPKKNTEGSSNPDTKFFFRTLPSSTPTAKKLALYLVKDKTIKNVVIFTESGKCFAEDFYNKLTEALKQYPTVKVTNYDLNEDKKIKERLEALKQQYNPKDTAIVILPDAYINKDSLLNPKKVLEENKNHFLVAGANTLFNQYYTGRGSDYINNSIVAVPWFANNNDVTDDFKQIMEKWDNTGVEKGYRHYLAFSYEATLVFTEAIQRVLQKGQPVTGSAIRDIIAAPDFTLTSPITAKEISFNGSDRTQDLSTLVEANCNDNPCKWKKI